MKSTKPVFGGAHALVFLVWFLVLMLGYPLWLVGQTGVLGFEFRAVVIPWHIYLR